MNFKEKIGDLSYLAEKKLKSFDIVDFSILFATLLSLGAFVNTLKSEFVKKIRPLLGLFSVLGSIYIALKVLKNDSVPYIKNKL